MKNTQKALLAFSGVMVVALLFVLFTPSTNDVLDYSSFDDQLMTSYSDIESIEGQRYIAYYYSETCGHCNDIKPVILEFFNNLDGFPVYLLDVSKASDSSEFDFYGTPTIHVIQDGVLLEQYIGTVFIEQFMEKYMDFDINDLEYSYFEDQHITTYDEALAIESDSYIIYYYLEDCPHCMRAKPDFLKWAWQRGYDEIYFMNGAKVSDPDNIPTELLILNSGTPILVVMTNGKFADEFYSGTDDVVDYITLIGDGEITTDNYTE